MKDLAKKAGLASQFHIESAATSREEIGNPVYPPARRKLTEHGISCVVNGPGEAREADIGIAGGKGEAVLFIHGQPIKKLTGDNILDQFMEEIYKI